jgi:crotonobetainyl-CoA:carnitine CoA-transferase CaiB-like acyl-CoA transferase
MGGTPNIATLIEKPDWKDSPLFSKPFVRMAEPEKFDAIIQPWMKEHDKSEITTKAQGLRLAYTPVLSGSELLRDAQLKSREYFGISKHPAMGEVLYLGAPAKLSRTPWQEGRAPLLGEHDKEVYTGLSYTEEDLIGMQRKKIIRHYLNASLV